MKQTTLFISLLLASLCLLACSTNGCEETRETFCYAALQSTSKQTLSHVSVYVGDSLAQEVGKPSAFEFILQPDTTCTTIRLEMTVNEDGKAGEPRQVCDTMEIHYEAYPYFINMECGCSVFFTLNEVKATHHFLQDITLLNKDISNEEDVNIRIEY